MNLFRVAAELGDPGDDSPNWVLSGSGPMAVAGLKAEPGDIDVFVKPKLWGALIEAGWRCVTPKAGDPPIARLGADGIFIDAFFAWDSRHEYGADVVDRVFRRAELLERSPSSPRLWATPLADVLAWKRIALARGHAKHSRDVAVLESALGRTDTAPAGVDIA